MGEHAPVQGRADPPRLRHRSLGDADHAGDDGRPRHGRPVQRPTPRGGRLRPAGRLPDRRHRQVAAADDRHRRPRRRAARHGARGVRPGRPRARADRAGERRPRRGSTAHRPIASRATCRSTPTSTPTCRPTATSPIDAYAAAALERGIAEIAITDHVDFEPRRAGLRLRDVRRSRADRPRRRRALGAAAASQIRFGVELTYDRSWEADIRDAPGPPRLRLHDRLGPRPGRTRRTARATSRRWVDGRSLAEIVAPYFDEVEAAARSGLFDAIGHIDVVKRYLHPHVTPADFAAAPELYEPILRALVESGTALEVNTSGLRYPIGETFPRPAIVARFRELGGRAVTVGSDAHRAEQFALGPRRRLRHRRRGRLRRADVPARPRCTAARRCRLAPNAEMRLDRDADGVARWSCQ